MSFFSRRKKKILVFVGHVYDDGKLGMLAKAYIAGAKAAGHQVEYICLGHLDFDPVLHDGYRSIQPLEPDLRYVQQAIKWCDHLAFFYPMWWSSMPAMLKGMFDRLWLPHFAFRFLPHGLGWRKLLKGKTARVYITMNNFPWAADLMFGDTHNEINLAILWFAGFRVRTVKRFGRIEGASKDRMERLKRKLFKLGKKAK